MSARTPVTIFSGLLGSGKTTIIMHLVEELQAQGKQIVYIKNEIGDVDIDSQMLRARNIKTRELLNGCICCTLVGPFTAALSEVVEQYHPARIFIESSGAADPSALALMVSAHPQLRRDGVIGVVDVLNFTGYKDLTETTRNQTKFIDVIVFNKIEQADLAQKRRVVGYIRELNTHSPIIEAPGGRVPSSALLGLDSSELTALLAETPETEPTQHAHIAHDAFEAFALRPKGKTSQNQLIECLQSLPPQVVRAKGIVQLQSGEWVICNMIGSRADVLPLELDSTQPLPTENLLVCIGVHAAEYEPAVTTALTAIFS